MLGLLCLWIKIFVYCASRFLVDDPKSNGFPFELKSADFGRKKGKEEHTVPNKEEDLKILKR